jgi:hypothetical protein
LNILLFLSPVVPRDDFGATGRCFTFTISTFQML